MGFAWPITAIASITHRIAGVVLFVGIGFGLFALQVSLSSETGFEGLKSMITSPLGKFITWGLLSALAYHFVAGIKHLIMDTGVGETLEGGIFAARASLFFSALLIALAALWVI
ncbi:MAG: succinate dehydrogenase, cytochrome b556 subunit [Pseudomonadales bacterium]|nr:succinate dehydrogenase, cytochrome b556 subunit [Pseudomonadales bacterium]MBO6565047.1 succinate dehydrogenase, cytochrome b556 subunit [Pseudomonadales bacterium]MBO6595012.1 succinate dehydrogenase, cytochrome b556 subunit [Pseudomonadales bacterium]MBO6658674.1 succinate dehydrogenase, cytochrome b556 subunit [Pseudomonadales bacterium]MBO6701517.1 succinate dehydrogenase, cytochrome b556 subunit [Pseudomonadales bacterium]